MRGVHVLAWCLLFLAVSSTGKANEDVETVRWNRKPITLSLPIGQERYIWFPGRVQPGVPPELTNKLRVQAVNDTINLLARKPFPETRLPVRSLDDGEFFLFDIKTDDTTVATPVRVVETAGRDEQSLLVAGASQAANQGADRQADAQDRGYVELTRFGAQQVYAPARLAKRIAGITNIPLPEAGEAISLYRGGSISTVPAASWRGQGGLYVTAVTAINGTDDSLELDPRLVGGDWLAATFHHRELGPKDTPSDTSTLYLISDRPFLEAAQS